MKTLFSVVIFVPFLACMVLTLQAGKDHISAKQCACVLEARR